MARLGGGELRGRGTPLLGREKVVQIPTYAAGMNFISGETRGDAEKIVLHVRSARVQLTVSGAGLEQLQRATFRGRRAPCER